MTRFLHLFILLSPAAVCLVWLAESGRLRRAFIDTACALRGLPSGRAAALAVLVLWATISGGDKQMSPLPPTAPESAGAEMQGEAVPETPLLSEPEGAGWPWAMPLWPFDAVVSNAVAGLSATNVPPIPDAMLESGLALYRAAAGVALEPRAPGAVPAYAWDHHAADNRGLEFTLPFAFPLGTNAYNRAGVLSNGRLSFGFHTLHRRTPGGLPFATPYPVVTLAPLWGPYGLLPSAGSGVWAQGDSNRFTVCWQDMLLHGDTNLPATAECDLLPGGAVRFRYGGIPGGAATNSTVGVQNLGPGWSFGGAAAPVFTGLELSLRPVAAAGWADADPDGDGLTNFEEFMIGTDEHLADTDGDGPSDSWEPAHGFDPLVAQFPDPDPDTDNDGVPDRWAGWMGDQLGDATNYYTLAALCADTDGDGFTGWYELFALGSNPNQAASPGAAPEGFVDMVAVVTSSLPCVLRLTGEAGYVEIPWMPGLSPERVRLRLEVGKAFQTELSRVPTGTVFPTNGFWWAGLISFEVPDFENQPPVVMEGVTIYWGGKVRVTTPDRAGDLWQTPGEAEVPPAAVEVWTINLDGPHVFCHSSGYAEVTVRSNSLYSGGIVWSSVPEGIEGEDNPLVIDPGEIPPGSYTVYAVSEENPAVTGETTVVISHLGLTETTVYVAYGDTNLTSIGISGDTYPQAGITVTSDPPGITNLSFRASDLEPGTYTVTVDNGSCETREAEITVIRVDIKRNGNVITGITTEVNVGEQVSLEGYVVPSGQSFDSSLWTVPDYDQLFYPKVIKNYIVNVSTGTVVLLNHDDLTNSAVAIYWVENDEGVEITYTVSINGSSYSASARFDVNRPTSTFSCDITEAVPPVAVRYDNANVYQRLTFGDEEYGLPGIAWTPIVTTTNNAAGKVALFQLINSHTVATGTASYVISTHGAHVLDSTAIPIPFTGKYSLHIPYDNVETSVNSNDSVVHEKVLGFPLSDSPAVIFHEIEEEIERLLNVQDAALRTVSRMDHFRTFLMYKPDGDGSIWVPLQKMEWFWSGASIKNEQTGVWSLVAGSGDSPSNAPEGEGTTAFPEWDNHFKNLSID